jgi:hypothetical protein
MANKLKVGETVYVPCVAFPELMENETALYKTKVLSLSPNARSVNVQLPHGAVSTPIGVGRVHRDVGILIIEIGDFISEAATLDPLAKSVLQFCRLLVPDDHLRLLKVRSIFELEMFWKINHAAYSHVILIGHGDKDVIPFALEGDAEVLDWESTLGSAKTLPKVFVSLACKTGFKSFGGEFSKLKFCKDFMGPFQSVHSAVASQFCQSFLTFHFLDGKTTKIAFNLASKNVPNGVSFRLWHNGKLC